jgi:hypothetical protein
MAFQPFVDLPQIKVLSDSPIDPNCLSDYPLEVEPSKLDPTENNIGILEPLPSPTVLDREARMQSHLSKIQRSFTGYTQVYADGTPYSFYPALSPLTLTDQDELQPYIGPSARYMSPNGSRGGDRSGTEIDSAPSEGSASPRSAWNYNSPYMQAEYGPGSLAFSPSHQSHHQAMEITDHPLPPRDRPLYGDHSVTLQELQHYPDPEAESAHYNQQFLEHNSGSYPSGLEENKGECEVEMDEDDEDDNECYSPTKKMKYTAPAPAMARKLRKQNKAKSTSKSTHRPGRPPTSKLNTSNPQLENQNASRLFACSFSHYGCTSTFRTKNEWKRHVTSQHLKLGFFRCDVDFCNAKEKKRAFTNSGNGLTTQSSPHDFNRKDLFTQHQRRMHKPPTLLANPTEQNKNAFEASLENVRQRCWIERRKAPAQSTCGFCGFHFKGPRGWEDRMEHVGKHYEQGDQNEREDVDLREWALEHGLIQPTRPGGWVLTGRD